MRLPELIEAVVKLDDEPAGGMFLWVTVKTTQKNDFVLLFGPTDAEGRIGISRSQFLGEAEAEKRMFMMDYGDPEYDATGVVSCEPCNAASIGRAIEAHNAYRAFTPYPKGYGGSLKRALARLQPFEKSGLLTVELLSPQGEWAFECLPVEA